MVISFSSFENLYVVKSSSYESNQMLMVFLDKYTHEYRIIDLTTATIFQESFNSKEDAYAHIYRLEEEGVFDIVYIRKIY